MTKGAIALTIRGRSQSRGKSHERGRSRSRFGTKSDVECYYYIKKGHIKRDCYSDEGEILYASKFDYVFCFL